MEKYTSKNSTIYNIRQYFENSIISNDRNLKYNNIYIYI